MDDKRHLEELVENGYAAEAESKISDLFKISAELKKTSKLIKDENEICNYYICFTENSGYLNKLNAMSYSELKILYSALKHPLLLVYPKENKLLRFVEDFEGLTPYYALSEKTSDKTENKRLHELYYKGNRTKFDSDLKYRKMYSVSAEIKKNGFEILLNTAEGKLPVYLTELKALGGNGGRILNYLSKLNNDDANRLIYITNRFSILDTVENVVYSMEAVNDKKRGEIVKLSKRDNKNGEYDNLYKILEILKKNPDTKTISLSDTENETYRPDSEPPSDMYR
jgi:hypothetical protein